MLQGVMGGVETLLLVLHVTQTDRMVDAARAMGMTSILIKTQILENDADQFSDIVAIHPGSESPANDLHDHSTNQIFL